MNTVKIIHQTWKTNEIPKELLFCVDSWKRNNSDWKYKLWTDEEMDIFVKNEFPKLYEIYKSYKTDIFRADLFRLLVIYSKGGAYVDLDMECIKSLDYLIENYIKDASLALSFEMPAQSIGVYNIKPLYAANFIYALPKNETLKQLIDLIVSNDTQNTDVIKTTGPIAITNALNSLLPNKGITILDWKIVNPILDVTNNTMMPYYKLKSLKMLLDREYYKETCMVHYWHGTYWKDNPPILLLEKSKLENEFKYLSNPFNYAYEVCIYIKRIAFLRNVYRLSAFLKAKFNWYKKFIEFIKK